jgi:HEPN domain-containing protein
MSLTKNVLEAYRWWDTARDDLQAAETLMASKMYAHTCFNCQQSGEKAMKALWFSVDGDPWGHSIQKLVADFPQQELLKEKGQWLLFAATLDKFYIPTRYPNGLPDLTPSQSYTSEDAQTALDRAKFLLDQVRLLLPAR